MSGNHRFSVRTPLGRVRGLGSAKSGTGHWFAQRLTALAMIPLSLWFLYALLTVLRGGSVEQVHLFFASPLNAVAMVLLLALLFWHGMLGLQVIIEDYVHCPCAALTLHILNKFLSVLLAAIGIVAVLKLHLLT
jgi:succinate dehydrogenase / fumarate reductase membrane anchor subunit